MKKKTLFVTFFCAFLTILFIFSVFVGDKNAVRTIKKNTNNNTVSITSNADSLQKCYPVLLDDKEKNLNVTSMDSDFIELSESEKVTLSNLYYNSFNNGFTDVKVTDTKSALKAIASVADSIGIGNTEEELSLINVNSFDGESYYRFQQVYQSIPVYGRDVVLVTDEEGNALSLTSNTIKIHQNAAIDNIEFDVNDIKEAIIQYYQNDGIDIEDIIIPDYKSENIVLYADGVNKVALAYNTTAIVCCDESAASYSVLYDINKQQIISSSNLYSNIGQNVSIYGSHGNSAIGWLDEGVYYAYNDKYKTTLFDFGGNVRQEKPNFDLTTYGYTPISSESNVFSDEYIDALSTFCLIGEYYSNLGDDVFDSYHVAVNANTAQKIGDKVVVDTGNAGGGSVCKDGASHALMFIGSDLHPDDVDVLAHEYTHAVSKRIVNWQKSEQTGALDEGLSDIFGILIEAKVKEMEAPKWFTSFDHSGELIRDCVSPSRYGYPETVTDKDTSGEDYSHAYSTIISHAAYLMWNGIDGDESKAL